MRLHTFIALLLVLSACATTEPSPKEPVTRDPRIANLQRAAALPWRDEGRCVVQEASQPWSVVVERCFHALDTRKIQFHDVEQRCTVASAGAAAAVPTLVSICLLSQPYIVVGAVVIIGAVVVAVAIKEELDAYELRRRYPEEETTREEAKPATREPLAKRRPKPEGSPAGEDWPPPVPPESPEPTERRPECKPVPVPHLGGNNLHNECADKIENNSFPGWDVLVNGKNFDALQLATRTLWEVKTDDFDEHSSHSQEFFVRMKLPEIQREKRLAKECGYNFVIGVRSPAHKAMLLELDPSLQVVVMDWC